LKKAPIFLKKYAHIKRAAMLQLGSIIKRAAMLQLGSVKFD
jgi:hypothetical protein